MRFWVKRVGMRLGAVTTLCLAGVVPAMGEATSATRVQYADFEKLVKAHEYKEADKFLDKWQSEAPGEVEVVIARANLLVAQADRGAYIGRVQPGKYPKELDPSDVLIVMNIATCYKNTRQTKKAREYFQKVLLMSKDNGMTDTAKEELRKLERAGRYSH